MRWQGARSLARVVALVGLDELREFARTNLGCNNTLLPKYLEALDASSAAAAADEGSSSQGNRQGGHEGGHETADDSTPSHSMPLAPVSTYPCSSAQVAMARLENNTTGVPRISLTRW